MCGQKTDALPKSRLITSRVCIPEMVHQENHLSALQCSASSQDTAATEHGWLLPTVSHVFNDCSRSLLFLQVFCCLCLFTSSHFFFSCIFSVLLNAGSSSTALSVLSFVWAMLLRMWWNLHEPSVLSQSQLGFKALCN